MATAHFTPELFKFLKDLERNNERDWFETNKPRYLAQVRDPLLQFISEVGPKLKRISPHFVADPRPNGGSMFRIYRDVRFSKDKRPYKTAATAQFRHERGKDVHAPGFYLHLGVKTVYMGAGIWQPDSPTVAAIRQAIVDDPKAWKRASTGKAFQAVMTLGGESLTRPPRGFDPDHPLIEDLKRKDFVCFREFTHAEAVSPKFLDQFIASCKTAKPLVQFITEACDLKF